MKKLFLCAAAIAVVFDSGAWGRKKVVIGDVIPGSFKCGALDGESKKVNAEAYQSQDENQIRQRSSSPGTKTPPPPIPPRGRSMSASSNPDLENSGADYSEDAALERQYKARLASPESYVGEHRGVGQKLNELNNRRMFRHSGNN